MNQNKCKRCKRRKYKFPIPCKLCYKCWNDWFDGRFNVNIFNDKTIQFTKGGFEDECEDSEQKSNDVSS